MNAIPQDLSDVLARSPVRPLNLGGRTLLPIFQGGMGVGVSGHKLAGAVAAQGGVGTLSSVDLRRQHPDLIGRTGPTSGENESGHMFFGAGGLSQLFCKVKGCFGLHG